MIWLAEWTEVNKPLAIWNFQTIPVQWPQQAHVDLRVSRNSTSAGHTPLNCGFLPPTKLLGLDYWSLSCVKHNPLTPISSPISLHPQRRFPQTRFIHFTPDQNELARLLNKALWGEKHGSISVWNKLAWFRYKRLRWTIGTRSLDSIQNKIAQFKCNAVRRGQQFYIIYLSLSILSFENDSETFSRFCNLNV